MSLLPPAPSLVLQFSLASPSIHIPSYFSNGGTLRHFTNARSSRDGPTGGSSSGNGGGSIKGRRSPISGIWGFNRNPIGGISIRSSTDDPANYDELHPEGYYQNFP